MGTVLVADAAPGVRRLIRIAIEGAGCEVVEAADGEQAWTLLARHRPAVVILDVWLPGRSGLAITRAIRAQPTLGGTYIVLLTGAACAADVAAGLEAGADRYVTKPFSPLELARAVERVLRGRRAGSGAARAAAPILVVDDDPAVRRVVADLLDAEGYAVETATNGAEALAALRRRHPALVLLDMRMPVLDGWGFARTARERGLDVPILVMTAAGDARRCCDEIGADGYLPKPFNLAQVLAAVEPHADMVG